MLCLISVVVVGSGRSFAKKLAAEGYEVTAVARTESRLKELMDELSEGKHRYIVADLSDPKGQAKVINEMQKHRYHLLINNAGFGAYGPFSHTELERLQEMMRLNCDAIACLAHAFLRQAESGDALVNVSSALAFLPLPNLGLYSATKAFVTSFSESLWFENLEKGIYVMGLCPGATETEFSTNSGRGEPPPGIVTGKQIGRAHV